MNDDAGDDDDDDYNNDDVDDIQIVGSLLVLGWISFTKLLFLVIAFSVAFLYTNPIAGSAWFTVSI